jgi:HEAT repeat protein
MGIFDLFKMMAIQRMRTKGDVEGLIDGLRYGEVSVQQASAVALGELGDAMAVEPLIQVLQYPSIQLKEVIVQSEAAKALGRIGDARAVEPLIRVLQDKAFRPVTRRSAAMALGELGDARAVNPLIEASDGATVQAELAKDEGCAKGGTSGSGGEISRCSARHVSHSGGGNRGAWENRRC